MSAKQHGVPCLYLLALKQPGVLLRAGTVQVSLIKLPLSRFDPDSRRPEACTRGRSRHTRCTVQATRASAQLRVCSPTPDSAGQPASRPAYVMPDSRLAGFRCEAGHVSDSTYILCC